MRYIFAFAIMIFPAIASALTCPSVEELTKFLENNNFEHGVKLPISHVGFTQQWYPIDPNNDMLDNVDCFDQVTFLQVDTGAPVVCTYSFNHIQAVTLANDDPGPYQTKVGASNSCFSTSCRAGDCQFIKSAVASKPKKK